MSQRPANPGLAAVQKGRQAGRTKNRDRSIALGLTAFLFSFYLLTFSGVYHSSDEMSMLVATDSLARRGAWDIELLRWMGEQQGSFGPDGHLYSRKGIGTTLAALPAYWLALQSESVGNVQAAMLTNGAITALTGALVYLLLRRLRYAQAPSLLTALAFGLATMAWPYARYLFSESLAGLGLMASAYGLVCFGVPARNGGQEGIPAGGSGRVPLLAGTGLGVALLARLNNAIAAPFLGLLLLVYLFRRHGRNWRAYVGPVLLFGLPVLAALAISAWYNLARFGNPLTTGYLPEERFTTPFLEGLYGLVLSPGKGLFWYNPVLFAALAGWPAFFRRHRAEALLVAAVVLANVAFYAPWYLWWAGHSWGPRFLVTVLPFAVLPLAPALEAARRRRGLAIALAVLSLVSVAVQIVGVAVDFDLYLEDIHGELGLYHPDTLFNPAYSPLLRQIAYIRPENLDLAWARGGTVNWGGLACGLVFLGLGSLALWAAWRGRLGQVLGTGLLGLLAPGAFVSLYFFAAPTGDAAQAAAMLARMERPGEAAALTVSQLTEAWQDAYDGRLWVWGVPSKEEVDAGQEATWSVGAGDPDPAPARFQVGAVRLDYYASTDQPFDDARIHGGPSAPQPRLDDLARLVAVCLSCDSGGEVTVERGQALPLVLYWRALASTDTSYTVFVHLIDPQGGKAGQLDRLPCHGGCPTTIWQAGDLIGEWLEIPIRADALPGRYQVIVGMYDLATGQNLPWLDAQGQGMGSYLVLGDVQVEE